VAHSFKLKQKKNAPRKKEFLIAVPTGLQLYRTNIQISTGS
jgi:hypothetical protein